jgi:cytochrome b subunit of formate dehydrogenase
MTWGLMYVLHGLAGVGLIALIMMHVYFGLRPEKLAITKSMIFGWMDRDFYLQEHDPERWVIETSSSSSSPSSSSASTSRRVEGRGLTDAG